MNFELAIGVTGVVVGLISFVFLFRYRFLFKQERKKRLLNTTVDLDMATTDQLVESLRTRRSPYLLIRPLANAKEGTMGLNMEVNSVPPQQVVGILAIVSQMSFQEMQRQGVLPEEPEDGFNPEDEQ